MRSVIGSRMLGDTEGSPRGMVRVTIQCGCGFEVTALGADDSHHDLFDAASNRLDEHIGDGNNDATCRPWIMRK